MRRSLNFTTFEAVLAEAERLARSPYERVGNWDLAQMCDHLADAVYGSMHGFDFAAPWILRKTISPLALWYVLKKRRIPIRAKMPKRREPASGKDPSACIARLREQIDEFGSRSGPVAAHPFFGRLSYEQWTQIHLIHCAHHLGFLVPAIESSVLQSAFASSR